MNFLTKLAIGFKSIFGPSEKLPENPTEAQVLEYLSEIPSLVEPLSKVKEIEGKMTQLSNQDFTAPVIKALAESGDFHTAVANAITGTIQASLETKMKEAIDGAIKTSLEDSKITESVTGKVTELLIEKKILNKSSDGVVSLGDAFIVDPKKQTEKTEGKLDSTDLFGAERPGIF